MKKYLLLIAAFLLLSISSPVFADSTTDAARAQAIAASNAAVNGHATSQPNNTSNRDMTSNTGLAVTKATDTNTNASLSAEKATVKTVTNKAAKTTNQSSVIAILTVLGLGLAAWLLYLKFSN